MINEPCFGVSAQPEWTFSFSVIIVIMSLPKILEPFGMILEYRKKDVRIFDKDVIVKSASFVYRGNTCESEMHPAVSCYPPKAKFFVSRNMSGEIRQNRPGEQWVRHATFHVRDGHISVPTLQVEWHFMKNQPVNLLLNGAGNLSGYDDWYEVHLTGVYVPDDDFRENRLRLRGS